MSVGDISPPGGKCWLCSLTPHLLRDAGAAAGLAAHGVALAGGEQRAGQDGAEVMEGAPARSLQVFAHQKRCWACPWEQFGQQRLLCVAVAAKRPHHPQQGRHCVPAQVLWKNRWWEMF